MQIIRVLFLLVVTSVAVLPARAHHESAELKEATDKYVSLYKEGRYAEAIVVARKTLALAEREFGPDNLDIVGTLRDVAVIHRKLGDYAEVESLYKRALTITAKARGSNHPYVAEDLHALADVYVDQGRYADAEPLLKRTLAIQERALDPEHPDIASSLNSLALLYWELGRLDEAKLLFNRALKIFEKSYGLEHANVGTALSNLANVYSDQGRYDDAEPLHKRSLAIREKALGPEHPDVAVSLNNLAELYRLQARYAEAERLYKRALRIKEKSLGSRHPSLATTLNNLATVYETQGRYAAAEPLHKRALAIMEEALGTGHPKLAHNLNNLAVLYKNQGRYSEAESLFNRVLETLEKAFGPNHPNIVAALRNLANLYAAQGRYADADRALRRALAIYREKFGPVDEGDRGTRDKAAGESPPREQIAEIVQGYEGILRREESKFGSKHPIVASALNNLAVVYEFQGRDAEAVPLLKRALAVIESVYGPNHPNAVTILNNLTQAYARQRASAAALEAARRATSILRARAAQGQPGLSIGSMRELQANRISFLAHLAVASALMALNQNERLALLAEAFEVAQLAHGSSTAAALAQLGARSAAVSGRLATIVRQRQDAVARWQELDTKLVESVSRPPEKRNPQADAAMRKKMAELDRRISEINAQFTGEFPHYGELANPKPVTLREAQTLLAPDEALLSYVVAGDTIFLFVVRHDKALLHMIDMDREKLNEIVRSLRAQLDPKVGRGLKRIETVTMARPFDIAAAHRLYQVVFAPASPLLVGVRHLLLVLEAPLESLPLGILVSETRPEPIHTDADYRSVAWLAKKFAITVLPSIGSLWVLRRFAKAGSASKPFVGFGDPLLKGPAGTLMEVPIAKLSNRGAVANADEVRKLPRLADTAVELKKIAANLGAGEDVIYLRERSTETRVRKMDLSSYRVVGFATHALVAGDFKGLGEPALVMTPPEQSSEEDDGLLTSSEITNLKLNADFVILSACNTAAPDGTPEAEGLSGLAKSFFYAGSRSLLVSHWAVISDATVDLTTRMFAELAKDSSIGRAEALRRARLRMLNDDRKPHYAHPTYWAPFIIVGEGGPQKRAEQ